MVWEEGVEIEFGVDVMHKERAVFSTSAINCISVRRLVVEMCKCVKQSWAVLDGIVLSE